MEQREAMRTGGEYSVLEEASMLYSSLLRTMPKKKTWDQFYAELVAYREKNGHCNVSRGDKQHASLGRWVEKQRQSQSSLLQYQMDRLNALGFVWEKIDGHDKRWNDKFERLQAYKQEHGHCLVPTRYGKDVSLGGWVDRQRSIYRQGTIREDRKARLEELGFVWDTAGLVVYTPKTTQSDEAAAAAAAIAAKESRNTTRTKTWDESYADLVVFYNKYGHCSVSKRRDKDFPRLRRWVRRQRQRRCFSSSSSGNINDQLLPLQPDQIDRLDALGFLWGLNVDRAEQWDTKFEKLKEYKRQHGDCMVPHRYKEEPSLGPWVGKQRSFHRQGILRQDRKARLDEIGFVWVIKTGRIPKKGRVPSMEDTSTKSKTTRELPPKKRAFHGSSATMEVSEWVEEQRRQSRRMDTSGMEGSPGR